MPTEIFPIQSRRAERAKVASMMQHVLAALTLVTNAVPHLQHGIRVLPVLEIAAAALLVGAAVRDRLRHRRGAHHDAVGWVEIAGSAMTFVEAIEKLQQRHHLLFYVLGFIPPVMLLLFGIFDMRIVRMRAITSDDERIELRNGIFFARHVRWSDLRAFRVHANRIEFDLDAGGAKTFKLRDLRNRDEAVEWMREQFRRRGIEELPAS